MVVSPKEKDILMISAGVGITPMLAHLRATRDLPPAPGSGAPARLSLLHCDRSLEQTVALDELRELHTSGVLSELEIVETRGMKQVTDTGAIEKAVDEVLAANPDKVEQAKAKPAMAGWFVGQVMKATSGKASPQAVNALIKSKLGID